MLLILPIFDWTATFILHRASAKTDSIALSERAKMAAVLAIATTLNAILAGNRVFSLHIGNQLAIILLSISLLLISVPNMYWLSLYLRSRLRRKKE